jgi:U5 small nuclear ribonucleoprotein component
VFKEVGLSLSKEELLLDVRPLVKLVMSRFFGDASAFVDIIMEHFPDPQRAATNKV